MRTILGTVTYAVGELVRDGSVLATAAVSSSFLFGLPTSKLRGKGCFVTTLGPLTT